MVSTYDSRREAFDASGDLKPYTIAKHYADEYLKQASVPYTIVHPGALLNDEGTNKIEVGAFLKVEVRFHEKMLLQSSIKLSQVTTI